jgi:hypothetical protein
MTRKTILFQRVFWMVIASVALIRPAASLAAPTRQIETLEKQSVVRVDDIYYLPSIGQLVHVGVSPRGVPVGTKGRAHPTLCLSALNIVGWAQLYRAQQQPTNLRPGVQALHSTVAGTPCQSEVSSSNADDLMQLERLGAFKIGGDAARILEILGKPKTKSKTVFSEADGLYRQSWYYPKQGMVFQLAGENKTDKPKIASIRLTRPSKLETDRGIRIGDSYDEVVRAYGRHQDQENSVPFKRLVAGSIYGGLVFSFQNGRVVEIFLGAAAE